MTQRNNEDRTEKGEFTTLFLPLDPSSYHTFEGKAYEVLLSI